MNRLIWLALIASRHNQKPLPRWFSKLFVYGMTLATAMIVLPPIALIIMAVLNL